MSVSNWVSGARSLASEARWRGFWGTVLALKLNKFGTKQYFVHEDALGNRYFENRQTSYGRDRWVEYSPQTTNADSSNVPPEWHAWLHHIIDEKPSEKPLSKKSWESNKFGNPTGTRDAYFPSHNPLSKKFEGLAKEKIAAWDPKHPTNASEVAEVDRYDLK